MPPRGYKKHNTICSVADCYEPSKYAGLCGAHYKRKWRHGNVETLIKPDKWTSTEFCAVDGCNNMTWASNSPYCKLHHQRDYRYGRTDNIIAAKGEGYTNSAGYKLIYINGRHQYEHIILAEKALGRPLPEGAVVHHMNEDKSDNYTPFNLVICPDQAYHLLLHRRSRR